MFWRVAFLASLLVASVLAQSSSSASASLSGSSGSSAGSSGSRALPLQSQTLAAQAANQLNNLLNSPPAGMNGAVADPLSFGSLPQNTDPFAPANTLPPFASVNSDATVSPPLAPQTSNALSLDLDRRIKQTEDLLNRMIWQLNRETAWANSVHDIIQNYQYKYTKVLSNIKKHTAAASKMRELAGALKKARLHEILENDLERATNELTELSSSSSETSADQGSYAALKDRVALMKQDLAKMSNVKVNKVLHQVQDGLKQAAQDAIPADSADTLKGLLAAETKK